MRNIVASKKYGILVGFVLFCVYLSVATQGIFISVENLLNVARQISINAILAAGMTFVIISGGIDLSVGSVLALVAVLTTSFVAHGTHVWHAIFLGIIFSLLVGVFNGFFITTFRIPPFISTLAMMTIARGIGFVYTGGEPISSLPDSYLFLGRGYLGKIPIPVIFTAVVFVLAYFLLNKTRFGRYVFAIGGNETAARLSGIEVKKIKLLVYVLMAVLAGLSGILLSARLGSGDPKLGMMYELDAIAAVVLGGTSLMGGEGSLGGTFLGALIIGVLDNGLILLGVSSFYQMVVKGFVILGAVLLDQLKD